LSKLGGAMYLFFIFHLIFVIFNIAMITFCYMPYLIQSYLSNRNIMKAWICFGLGMSSLIISSFSTGYLITK